VSWPTKLVRSPRPFPEMPAPPEVGESRQISWYRVEAIAGPVYLLRNVEGSELLRDPSWESLCARMNWRPRTMGDKAIERYQHARRYAVGDSFEGRRVERVFVVSHDVVVLMVDDQIVHLSSRDEVLRRRPRFLAPVDEPEPPAPAAAPREVPDAASPEPAQLSLL